MPSHGTDADRCFDNDGIKTEYSLVEIDCLDRNQRHTLLPPE